ncbi:unnamed protein product, partial [Ostreobium quekettii]
MIASTALLWELDVCPPGGTKTVLINCFNNVLRAVELIIEDFQIANYNKCHDCLRVAAEEDNLHALHLEYKDDVRTRDHTVIIMRDEINGWLENTITNGALGAADRSMLLALSGCGPFPKKTNSQQEKWKKTAGEIDVPTTYVAI